MAVSFALCGLGLFAVVWSGAVKSSTGFLAAVVLDTFFWSPSTPVPERYR